MDARQDYAEQDFTGMPISDPTSLHEQDAQGTQGEDYGNQDAAFSGGLYGSYSPEDVDPQVHYGGHPTVPENFSPTVQSPDFEAESGEAADGLNDSGYMDSPPSGGPVALQNDDSADSGDVPCKTAGTKQHGDEQAPFRGTSAPSSPSAQAKKMWTMRQTDQSPTFEEKCNLAEHGAPHQSLQENCSHHSPPQRPQQRQPDPQLITTVPKLVWKKPTPNMQIYRRSSGRGFSRGIVPSSVSVRAQSRPFASQYYTKPRTPPSAGLQPQPAIAVPSPQPAAFVAPRQLTTDASPPPSTAVLHPDREEPPGESQIAGGEIKNRNDSARHSSNGQATPPQHDPEKENLTAQLQRTTDVNQKLQSHTERLHRENKTLRESQARSNSLKIRANYFKTFLTGIGSDLNELRHQEDARRKTTAELFRDLDATKATHHALIEQSAQLKAEALKVAREAHAELATKTLYATHLKEQLDEKCQMLTDEKNYRLQLQSKLLNNTNEDVERQLKKCTDAVLDKLFEIHAEIEQSGVDETIEKKLVAAVQGLVSQQVVTVQDIASIKGTVDVVLESLQSLTTTTEKGSNLESSITSHLDETFKNLKADMCRHEDLVVQATIDRESIARLTEELQDSNKKIADQTTALEASRTSYEDLKERHIVLQGQADSVAQSVAKHDADMERMLTFKADVQTQTKALEARSADLATKTSEANTLSDANSTLRAEVESLQEALTSAQAQARPAADPEEFAEKLSAAVKAAKEEVSRNANDLHVRDKIESANNLKKIASARDELIERNAHLQAALASAQDEAKLSAGQQQNFVKVQKLADDRKLELQSLQARVDALTQSVALSRDAEDQYAELNVQHIAQTKQLDEIVLHRAQLVQQLECAQSQLEDCKNEIQAAKQRAQNYELNAQHELNSEQEKARKQADALQQEIQTLQAELHVQAEKSKKDQYNLQDSWMDNEKRQKEEITRLTDLAAQAEAGKDHAVAECLHLESELAKATASLMGQPGPHPRSPNHPAHDLAVEASPMPRAKQRLQEGSALNLSQAHSEALAVVQKTPPRTYQAGKSVLHSDASTHVSQHDHGDAAIGASQQVASQSFLGSSQGYAAGAEETQEFVDRLTKADMRASTRSTFEFTAQHKFAIPQDNPAGVNDRIQTGSSQGGRSTLGDERESSKRMPPPNSSVKRAQPRGVSRSGDNAGPFQQSSRYTTPEPRAAKSVVDNGRMSGKSSSPDFMVSSSRAMTSYQGAGKHNSGAKARGGAATPQAKRKADTQVVQGYESQRKKLMAKEPGRGRSGLRSLSQAPVRTLAESGLQPELETSQSGQFRLRVPTGPHGRSKGGAKKLNHGERMSARFAKELSG